MKHRSLDGWRLLIAVPESPDLAPQIVLDALGAGIGQTVMISSDGSEARKMVGDERSPVLDSTQRCIRDDGSGRRWRGCLGR